MFNILPPADLTQLILNILFQSSLTEIFRPAGPGVNQTEMTNNKHLSNFLIYFISSRHNRLIILRHSPTLYIVDQQAVAELCQAQQLLSNYQFEIMSQWTDVSCWWSSVSLAVRGNERVKMSWGLEYKILQVLMLLKTSLQPQVNLTVLGLDMNMTLHNKP